MLPVIKVGFHFHNVILMNSTCVLQQLEDLDLIQTLIKIILGIFDYLETDLVLIAVLVLFRTQIETSVCCAEGGAPKLALDQVIVCEDGSRLQNQILSGFESRFLRFGDDGEVEAFHLSCLALSRGINTRKVRDRFTLHITFLAFHLQFLPVTLVVRIFLPTQRRIFDHLRLIPLLLLIQYQLSLLQIPFKILVGTIELL
mmetsp:Transcript_22435/g.46877  ORF Transcript_22435/g.46877 Transcript_22435/m.46877 type:complete len:200 (-) Transcript_22435:2221-2820(-)